MKRLFRRIRRDPLRLELDYWEAIEVELALLERVERGQCADDVHDLRLRVSKAVQRQWPTA